MTDNPWLLFITIMVFISAILGLVLWGVGIVIDVIPDADRGKVASASLVASSILFGFAATSLIRLSGQLLDASRNLSDVAKELVDVYGSVKNDKQLRSKKLGWKTKVWDYGMGGYGREAPALEAISGAYKHLLTSIRFSISVAREIVYLFYITSLCLLILSIFTSLLVTGGFQETFLRWALTSLVSATLLTLIGWLTCNRLLTQIVDSLLNIRHQVYGGIADICPY